MNIEYVAAGKDFVGNVVFPNKKEWQDLEILFIGDNQHREGWEILNRQFPQSGILVTDIAIFLAPHFLPSHKRYDYIYIEPAVSKAFGVAIFKKLQRMLSLLKPGGVMCMTVYGYTGYYGLEMLRTIIKQVVAAEEDFSMHELEVARAVVSNLPTDHPAYLCKPFMERLLKGDALTFRELLTISADNIFTVSQLFAHITRNGGHFLRWVQPEKYEPDLYIQEKSVLENLTRLPHPQRWEVAELVNAAPDEHYFLISE